MVREMREREGGRKACQMLLSNVKELIQLWDGHSHSLLFVYRGCILTYCPSFTDHLTLSMIVSSSVCVVRVFGCLSAWKDPCTHSLPFSLPDLASFGSVCVSLNRRVRERDKKVASLRCVRVMSLLDECVCGC